MNRIIGSTVAALALSVSLAHAGGDVKAGKEKAAPCFACHGETGVSPAPLYPHIGGQYATYLLHSLEAYKSGERKNAIMQGMVGALSTHDMQDLAAYFASLDGVLRDGSLNP